MIGTPPADDAARDACHDCGGKSLMEDSPQRLEARRTLNAIYAGMRRPPSVGENG